MEVYPGISFPILQCVTPKKWLDMVSDQLDVLLIDHAHCEKKAASTAISFIYRYPNKTELICRMSRIVREEMRHFEQVIKLLARREVEYRHLTPGRYAQSLFKHARTHEPEKLIDTLIIGAFVEARSCERFAAMLPVIDQELATFYRGLLHSEASHYKHYLSYAKRVSEKAIDHRIKMFGDIEAELIQSPDDTFRFHSGVPQ